MVLLFSVTELQQNLYNNIWNISVYFYWILVEISNLFFLPPDVDGKVLSKRVCPSFHPYLHSSVCPGIFLEFHHFGMVLENYMKLWVTVPEFLENFSGPNRSKMDQKWAISKVFWIYWKIRSLFSLNMLYNVPRQSDFSINHISRTNHWNNWFFAYWYKFT